MRADGSVDGRRQTEAQKISSSFPTQKAQPDHKKRRQEASLVLPLRTPERIGLITYDAKDPLILDQGAPTLGTYGSQTPRWSGMDSNLQFRAR